MMPQITIGYGVLLIVLGVGGFFGSGMASLTALIPAVFGLLFAIAGAVAAANTKARKHVMHLTSAVALVAIVMTGSGIPVAKKAMDGEDVGGDSKAFAAYSKTVMCGLSSVYFLACLGSFLGARRRRKAAEGGAK